MATVSGSVGWASYGNYVWLSGVGWLEKLCLFQWGELATATVSSSVGRASYENCVWLSGVC